MFAFDDLLAAVQGARPCQDERFRISRELTLRLLEQGAAALDRHNYQPGHITGSGIVLTADRREVLLIFHRKLGRWLQPGGHVEPEDTSIVDTAAREVREETGLVVPAGHPVLVSIDVHEIPARGAEPAHRHHDLVWRFIVPAANNVAGSERSAWWPIPELDTAGPDEALRSAVARAVAEP